MLLQRPGATEATIGGSVVMGQRQLLVAVLSWEHKMARYSSTDLGSVQSMVCIETGIVCVCMCVQGQSYSDRSVSIVCG